MIEEHTHLYHKEKLREIFIVFPFSPQGFSYSTDFFLQSQSSKWEGEKEYITFPRNIGLDPASFSASEKGKRCPL